MGAENYTPFVVAAVALIKSALQTLFQYGAVYLWRLVSGTENNFKL